MSLKNIESKSKLVFLFYVQILPTNKNLKMKKLNWNNNNENTNHELELARKSVNVNDLEATVVVEKGGYTWICMYRIQIPYRFVLEILVVPSGMKCLI